METSDTICLVGSVQYGISFLYAYDVLQLLPVYQFLTTIYSYYTMSATEKYYADKYPEYTVQLIFNGLVVMVLPIFS